MQKTNLENKKNKLSGFMTFIFVWYLLGAVSHGMGLINSAFSLIIMLIASPRLGIVFLGLIGVSTIMLVLLIIYLIKVYGMKSDLKKWTDIYHLISIINSSVSLIVLLIVGPVLLASIAELNVTNFTILIGTFFSIMILIDTGFWLGIRYHLARLEREGKAKFTPGLFNKKA